MAISGGDGSIILTTKVDESGLKKGMQQANKFAQMSTNEQRRMAQSLSKVYRQQGMSQSEAQKKAWHDLKNNTVATKDLAKATEDVAKKTEQATKETKEYGNTAKRSGTIAKKAFLAVGKAFLTIGVASASAIVAMTKQAVSAYADYEQLIGGVETLFKGSAQKVVDYANDAFATAGMSANQYMEQVIGISAMLIKSTGDTEKAADVANMAITDMADNVNKMGTDMTRVQMAYQGFARQQYVLLDNLAIGYGGTKQEMERLLRDAQAITGVKYDINNLADVYSAIHAIQTELGITGTTAKEAEQTVTGSANMMKAAWQNVLSAIAGGGDLDKAINNLVYSIQKYFENIVPVVERSLQGIGQLIERVAPMLVQSVARALIKAIPSLLNAIYQMVIGLAKGIYEGIVALFSGGTQKVVEAQTNQIAESVKNQNELTEAVEETNKALKGSLAGFDEINTLTNSAEENLDFSSIGGAIGTGTTVDIETKEAENKFSALTEKILEFIKPITDALGRLFKPIKKSFDEIDWGGMKEEVSSWLSSFSSTRIDAIAKGIDSIRVSFETLKEPLQDFWNNTLKPIVEDFGGWIIDIVKKIGESFDYFSEKLVEYKDEIEMVIDGISVIIQTIWAIISPIIDSAVKGIGNVLKTTIDFIFSIIQALGNFFAFFGNIFNAIKSLFQGNLDDALMYAKKALANLVNIFVGVANAIISVINNLWSLIFDAFKGTVNAIGGLIEKIGSWIGFDWNLQWGAQAPLIPLIPKYVPKLAQGTVVPPNKEFMAVLGDNKREHEIVSPLSTMKQAVAEVLAQANIGGGFNGRIEVPVIIDGREVARAVREAENTFGTQTVFGGFANVY